MRIKLHRFVVIELRIGKEAPRDVLPRRHLENRLSAHALVNVQRHRIDLERLRLAFPRPFQPGIGRH